VDKQGEELPRGIAGELMCSTVALRGGAADLGQTNGWHRTGDLAVLDELGNVQILGRVDELLLRGAHRIAPREIEEALEEHPSVDRAAVIGVPTAADVEIWAFVTSTTE